MITNFTKKMQYRTDNINYNIDELLSKISMTSIYRDVIFSLYSLFSLSSLTPLTTVMVKRLAGQTAV